MRAALVLPDLPEPQYAPLGGVCKRMHTVQLCTLHARHTHHTNIQQYSLHSYAQKYIIISHQSESDSESMSHHNF